MNERTNVSISDVERYCIMNEKNAAKFSIIYKNYIYMKFISEIFYINLKLCP